MATETVVVVRKNPEGLLKSGQIDTRKLDSCRTLGLGGSKHTGEEDSVEK